MLFGDNTIGWYRKRRQPKRRFGLAMRLGALLLTAAAGLVPLSDQLGLPGIPATWGTVMLGVAGVFVSLDVFAGATSGWIRYMLAQQQVERLRAEFLMDWNALRRAGGAPKDMLQRAKAFLLAVELVVDGETREWATEFQNALKEMDRVRKDAADVERLGAVEVSVKNPEAVDEWTLEIDGSERGRTSGANLAVTGVPVGVRKLRAHGEDLQGNRRSDEKTIKVEGGATVRRELELS